MPSLVVVCSALGQPGAQRQHRLGAVERLQLRLLVEAEHKRSFGRVEVEADDLDHLRNKLRVAAVLERAGAVGLEPVPAPDPIHRRARQARLACEPADAPVRLAGRRRLERLCEQVLDRLLVDRRRSARARPIAQTRSAPRGQTAPARGRPSATTAPAGQRSRCCSLPLQPARRSALAARLSGQSTESAAAGGAPLPVRARARSPWQRAARAQPYYKSLSLSMDYWDGTLGTVCHRGQRGTLGSAK